jgi:hypothetical protein
MKCRKIIMSDDGGVVISHFKVLPGTSVEGLNQEAKCGT